MTEETPLYITPEQYSFLKDLSELEIHNLKLAKLIKEYLFTIKVNKKVDIKLAGQVLKHFKDVFPFSGPPVDIITISKEEIIANKILQVIEVGNATPLWVKETIINTLKENYIC